MGRFVKNREIESQSYSARMPFGPTALRTSTPVNGLFRFNTDTNRMEVYYNATWNTMAKVGVVEIVKDSQGAAPPGANLESANGSRTTFTMSRSYTAGQETQVLVYVGNIFQNPGVAYTFNGTTTITFTSPPPLGQTIIILHNLPSTDTI